MARMESLHLGRPYAVMMVGVPGSGKSFFASQFAETFHAPYVDSLVVERLSRDNAAAGELIGVILGEVVKTKQTFVFEGNSDSRTHRSEFARWARNKGYQPVFIWVQTDQRTSLQRSLKAKTLSKDAFNEILRGFSAPHEDEKAIVISGRHTYASQARVVLAQLSKIARPQTAAPAARPTGVQPPRRSITIR